jgi:hypothetical protein
MHGITCQRLQLRVMIGGEDVMQILVVISTSHTKLMYED